MARKAKRDLTIEQKLARGPIDLPFLALVMILVAVGVIMVLSASFASAMYNLDPDVDTGEIKDNLAAKQINYEIQPHSSKTIG